MNWKRIAVTGIIAGMIAVTGCSTNLPETNQGNRNGQRVTDSVNRRADTYRTTSNRLGMTENSGMYRTDGIAGRTTRGMRRTANNAAGATRNNYGRYHNTYNHTTTPNRSLNIGRPQGRIGNTFRYGHQSGYTHGLNEYGSHTGYSQGMTGYSGRAAHSQGMNQQLHGYDMGVTTSDQALVNNRTTRNTTNNTASAVAAPNNNTAVTNRAAANPTRSNTATTKTETKRVDTKREDKKAKSAAKKHETAPARSSTTHRAGTHTSRAAHSAPRIAQNRNTASTRNLGARHMAPHAIAQHNNPTVARSAGHYSRHGMHNTASRAVRRNYHANRVNNSRINNHVGMTHHMNQNNQFSTRNAGYYNRYGMTLNTNRVARRNHDVNRTSSYGRINTGINVAPNMQETVAVVSHDDNFDMDTASNEMAFFRKKTEEPTNTTTPQMPMTPPAMPLPNNLRQSYDDSHFNSNKSDGSSRYNSNNNVTTPQQAAPKATPKTEPQHKVPTTPTRLPVRTTTHRATK